MDINLKPIAICVFALTMAVTPVLAVSDVNDTAVEQTNGAKANVQQAQEKDSVQVNNNNASIEQEAVPDYDWLLWRFYI